MTTMYNAHYEFPEEKLTEDRAVQILDDLEGMHPAVGNTPDGRLDVRITFPAEDLAAAQKIGLQMSVAAAAGRSVGVHAGSMPVFAEVMTEEEFVRREGFTPVPDLLSVSQASEQLGYSRQRILQMIEEGKFPTAKQVGNAWVIACSDVDAKKTAPSPS